MFKGGRPKDSIWAQYDESTEKGKMNCKACSTPVSAKADRLRSHHKKCSASFKEPPSVGDAFACLQVAVKPEPAAVMVEQSRPPKKLQSSLLGHVVTTSKADKEEIDLCVAEFFYACNIAFNAAEHPKFLAMCEALRAGYKPPTRKAIGGVLLDKVHTKLQTSMKDKLQDKTVTMQQDGWSTPSNEPVISTSVTCEGVGYFMDAQLTGSKSKTAEACQEMLEESKAFAEQTFGCKVRSVVTDNAPAMAKMRDGLERDDHDVITYGCMAHWLNLLGADITDSALLKRVEDILRPFRKQHTPSALLREYQDSVRPQLSNDTRWNSQLDCMDSYIKNRTFMIDIIQKHPQAIDNKVQRAIMDNTLFRKVVDMTNMLRPISIALLRAQADSTSLADGYDIMLKLVSDPVLQPQLSKIKKRRAQAIQPCHMVAYMLHPKYSGQGMDSEDAESARAWLAEISQEYVAAAITFQAQASPYPQSFFQPAVLAMNPSTWWKSIGKNCKLPEGFVD